MYSSSRLLEGHDRNTVFQTIGWFLALLSVRTLQTKSLWLCLHWHIKEEKDTAWSWIDYRMLFHFYAFLKSNLFLVYNCIGVFYFLFWGYLNNWSSKSINYIVITSTLTVKWLFDSICCFSIKTINNNIIIISNFNDCFREINVVGEKMKKKEEI